MRGNYGKGGYGRPGEAKFEGVMWHAGYDQSITSSAARAPHTAPILPGPLPFVRYTSAATRGQRGDGQRMAREEGPREADVRLQIRLPATTSPGPVGNRA